MILGLLQQTREFVELGSSAVECRTRNRESPGSNPLCSWFKVWVLSLSPRRPSPLSCLNVDPESERCARTGGGATKEDRHLWRNTIADVLRTTTTDGWLVNWGIVDGTKLPNLRNGSAGIRIIAFSIRRSGVLPPRNKRMSTFQGVTAAWLWNVKSWIKHVHNYERYYFQ